MTSGVRDPYEGASHLLVPTESLIEWRTRFRDWHAAHDTVATRYHGPDRDGEAQAAWDESLSAAMLLLADMSYNLGFFSATDPAPAARHDDKVA